MRPAMHISLNVSDLDRSADFYARFLGEPAKRKPGSVKFVTSEPDLHLALQAALVNRSGGSALSHLGIRVSSKEEVLRWKRVLTERGLLLREETQTACCYALQEKIWITDPDGNRWEIYTVLEDLSEAAGTPSRAGREPQAGELCCPPDAGFPWRS